MLVEKDQIRLVAALFLLGTGSQVIGAVLSKISNWYVYRGTIDEPYLQTCRYKFFHWFVRQFWIDVCVNMATVAVFWLAMTVDRDTTPITSTMVFQCH
jgi:hypothetical protein